MIFQKMFKGFRHKPVLTVLCLLALVAGFVLPALEISANTTVAGTQIVEKKPVEIAVPRADLFETVKDSKKLSAFYDKLNKWVKDGGMDAKKPMFKSLERLEIQTLVAAYAEALTPVVADEIGEIKNADALRTRGVFLVRCTNVKVYEETSNWGNYTYNCEVLQAVAKNIGCSDMSVLNIIDVSKTPGAAMEEGKTYLVWGAPIVRGKNDNERDIVLGDRQSNIVSVVEQNGKHFLAQSETDASNKTPIISEVQGDLAAFWQTEIGKLWQSAVIEKLKAEDHALVMVGTTSLENIYAFNVGGCSFVSGGEDAAAQFAGNERVCVISEELAEQNGLGIGSTVSAKLFNSEYFYERRGNVLQSTDGYNPYDGFKEEGEWRVVGIYHTNYDTLGIYAIHPNTIFVPKASITKEYPLKNTNIPHLYLTMVLPEGGTEAMQEEIATEGYMGWFVFGDGRRAQLEAEQAELLGAVSTWQSAVQSKVKAFPVISWVLFGVAMLAFALAKKKEIGKLYSIETGKRTLFLHVLLQGVLMGAVAFGISFLLGSFVLPGVTENLLRSAADPQFADVLMESLPGGKAELLPTFGKQALILLAAMVVAAAIAALRKYHFYYHEEGGEANSDRI